MNLGAILHMNGKYREAEGSYLTALELKPADDVTLLNLKKLRQLQSRANQSSSLGCRHEETLPTHGRQNIPEEKNS